MSLDAEKKGGWSVIGAVILSLLTAAALITLWLIWQGPDALPGVSPDNRLKTTVAAILVVVLGASVLLQTGSPKVRKRFTWGLTALGLAAVFATWYSNSVLKVSPSSARIPVGSSVPLTAGPMTLLERIRGRQLTVWSSSDTGTAKVVWTTDSSNGNVAMVSGVNPGRATIFAVRGRVRSESRLSVENAQHVIPPVCTVRSADTPPAGRAPPANPRSGTGRHGTPLRERARSSGSSADSASGERADTNASAVAVAPSTTCIAGTISSPGGQAVRRAKVSLKALGEKSDTLWVQYNLTDPVDGRYEFLIPPDTNKSPSSFLLSVHQQVGEVNPVWFLPTQWGLDTASRVLDARLVRAGAFQNGIDIKLQYSSQSAFSMLLLLLPGIFGLTSTVLYYSAVRPDGGGPKPGSPDRERAIVRNYVLSNVLVWGGLLGLFAMLYAFRGVQAIPLFGERVAVPTVAPTFAYLGVLVYAIYVLAADYLHALKNQTSLLSTDRQLLLLSLVNRIVIAPYVAIVAVVAVFSKLDQPMVPFVAFFTGLWIEPVLGTLKEIGDRLVRRSDEPDTLKLPTPVALLDRAKALLAQKKAALLKDEPDSDAEAVATTTGEGKAGAKIVVYLKAPEAEFETRAKKFPEKLEGILSDGTSVSFPVEVK